LSETSYSPFQPNRILIIEFGTIRDVLRTLPVINILRLRFPLAEIAWLVNQEVIDFLSSYQIVDRLIIAKSSWFTKLCDTKVLRRRLHAFAPDVCLDLHGTWQSGFASWLSGCKRRISFAGKGSRFDGRLFANIKVQTNSPHELEKRLQLLEVLDVAGSSVDYDLPITTHEKKAAAEILREFGLESAAFALLGVSEPSTAAFWKQKSYVQIARYLADELEIPVIAVYQNEEEKAVAESIIEDSGEMAFLAPELSAVQFTALARQSSLYVGSDNDFLHLAAAVETPTIGILRTKHSLNDTPYCDNFQWIRTTLTEKYHQIFPPAPLIFPFSTDDDAYDIMRVCDACDEILQPTELEDFTPAFPMPVAEYQTAVFAY